MGRDLATNQRWQAQRPRAERSSLLQLDGDSVGRLSGSVLLGVLHRAGHANAQPAQSSHQQPAGAVNPITVDSTEEQIRQAVGTARVGGKLTPKTWPNGARVAVCLSFDVDNELLQRANPLPVPLSVAEYGATTSVPRILEFLDRHQVPATFFIPAMGVMLHPEMVPAIVARHRHEIGVHGWVHEFWPGIGDAAKEPRLLTQSIAYLTKASGKRPVGVRAPGSGFGPQVRSDPKGRVPVRQQSDRRRRTLRDRLERAAERCDRTSDQRGR